MGMRADAFSDGFPSHEKAPSTIHLDGGGFKPFLFVESSNYELRHPIANIV